MTASSAGLCQSESNSLPYMAALATIQLALLAYGNYLVYKTRMVDTRFQESRWIAFAMVCYFEILALALPVLALVSDKVEAGYIVKAGVVFLNNITIFCASSFSPKFSPLNSAPASLIQGQLFTLLGTRSRARTKPRTAEHRQPSRGKVRVQTDTATFHNQIKTLLFFSKVNAFLKYNEYIILYCIMRFGHTASSCSSPDLVVA